MKKQRVKILTSHFAIRPCLKNVMTVSLVLCPLKTSKNLRLSVFRMYRSKDSFIPFFETLQSILKNIFKQWVSIWHGLLLKNIPRPLSDQVSLKILCPMTLFKSTLHVRRSYPEVFCKNGVLINFEKFTRKHLRQSPFVGK